jgi:hypothetical protein
MKKQVLITAALWLSICVTGLFTFIYVFDMFIDGYTFEAQSFQCTNQGCGIGPNYVIIPADLFWQNVGLMLIMIASWFLTLGMLYAKTQSDELFSLKQFKAQLDDLIQALHKKYDKDKENKYAQKK